MTRRAVLVGSPLPDSRLLQHGEALWLAGWEVRLVAPGLELVDHLGGLPGGEPVDLLLLRGVTDVAPLRPLIDTVRGSGGQVLADVDVLPEGGWRRVVRDCDGCLVATAALQEQLEGWGLPAAVVPPALDLEALRLSTQGYQARLRGIEPCAQVPEGPSAGEAVPQLGLVVEGADAVLPELEEMLLSLLEARPALRLRVFGRLGEGGSWRRIGDRLVEGCPPAFALPSTLAACQVLLLPQPLADPAAARSVEWFLRAGAVGVPVVASATVELAGVIRDGQTGFLVGEPGEWLSRLDRLLSDEALARQMGAAARSLVVGDWITDVRAAQLVAALEALAGHPPRPHPRRRVLVARPTAGSDLVLSGSLMAGLAAAGYEIETGSSAGPPAESSAEAARADVAVAVGASKVPALEGTEATVRLLVASDDAALHQPMGPELVAAEDCHRGLETLALGPWLAGWLAERYRVPIHRLGYPILGHVFYPGPARRRPVVAYDVSRLEQPPESDLGLQTLMRLARQVKDLEVVLFGTADDLSGFNPAFEYRWLGRLSPAGRARLFRRAAALLYTGCTNLPLTVLEAMACGCAVAAIDTAAGRWLLKDGLTARLASPRPSALADVLEEVLEEPCRRRLAGGAAEALERLDERRTRWALVEAVEAACAAQKDGEPAWRWYELRAAAEGAVLDVLQPQGEARAPAVDTGGSIGQSFRCHHDGLCRIDVRLSVCGTPGGVVRLRLGRGPFDEDDLASSNLPLAAVVDGQWATFSFSPLAQSAGEYFFLRLEMAGGAGGSEGGRQSAGGVVAPLWADGVRFQDGRAHVAGEATDRVLAFRTFCRPSVPAAIGLAADPELLLNRLAALDQEVHQEWLAFEADRDTLPYRLLHARQWLRRPLPPYDERPWRPTDRALVKLWRMVRHFGPLAPFRELSAWWRWQRMSPTEREQALRDGD